MKVGPRHFMQSVENIITGAFFLFLFVLLFLSPKVDRRNVVTLEWNDNGVMCSKSLQDIAAAASQRSEPDQQTLDYFQAQLDLFSKMCFYRQYLGINRVKELLPIHIVLRLAPELRQTHGCLQT